MIGSRAGYDSLALHRNLLLDLPFKEGTGANTQDWSKAHRACVLTGMPTWQGPGYLNFASVNPDYIMSTQADTVDLDFTSGDFSVAAWLRPHVLGDCCVLYRASSGVDGWSFWLDANGAMVLSTNQAGAAQLTRGTAGDVVIGAWTLVGAARSGASVRVYTDGRDTTDAPAVHVDPVTANRNLYIGVGDLAAAGGYDGHLFRPRIWDRRLAPFEFRSMFRMDSRPYGNLVFVIGHECGDLSEYDSVVDPDGDLTVTMAAALNGTQYGLNCLINDLNNKTARKKNLSPPASGHLGFRFYVDPNTFTVNDGDMLVVARIGCEPYTPDSLFHVALGKNLAGDYRLRCVPRDDTQKLTARNFAITDAEHYVELHCKRASSSVASDGIFEWLVDGDFRNTWADVDNWDIFAAIDDMRVGLASNPPAGTLGTIYLDEFVLRGDDAYIGA